MIANQRSRSSVSSRTFRRCGKCNTSAVSSSMSHLSVPWAVHNAAKGTHAPAWRKPCIVANGQCFLGACAKPRAASHLRGMLAPATESPIAVDRLVKRYKSVTAVDDNSFAIAAGSCTALLGGNGAGKTTTISTIMGLVEPTAGQVTVLGVAMPRQRHRVLHRMNFESPYVNMPMRLTVRQNMNVFGMLYGCEDVAARIHALADELELPEFLDRQTGKLSSGQKPRVALAKSLINQPEILLLDEPTASLDPDTADWVRGRLERYRRERGATLLLASHNMNEAERLCDRVIMLKTGRIEDDD